jgi:hypothetical protein
LIKANTCGTIAAAASPWPRRAAISSSDVAGQSARRGGDREGGHSTEEQSLAQASSGDHARGGTVILLRCDTALIRGGRTFLDALQSGAQIGFADQYMCMAPQFEVGDGRYEWLTRNLFVGRGRLAGPKQIEYEIHRVV